MSADGLPLASERLALSRERLRQAMRGTASPHTAPAGAGSPGPTPGWLAGLMSIPAAGVVVSAVRGWWAQHPLRIASLVAADAAQGVLRPLAQRHPLGLVAGALLLGGLVVWAKPWRGVLKPALLAGLLPQLASKAMAAIPVESWMAVLTSLAQQPARAAQPGPDSEPAPPAQAPLH
jgi:hypothetical protein